jgi:hypothetical protein
VTAPALFGTTPAAGLSPRPAAGPTPLVIGLDLSLTSTGIAGTDWADALRTKGRGHVRLAWLRQEITERVRLADLVVVEGPSAGWPTAAQPGSGASA